MDQPSSSRSDDRPVGVFLSYARGDDEAFVARLHADLTARGFDVWFDRVSMPSRQLSFTQEIRDAIAARERLVLVVGPMAAEREYVRKEWGEALELDKCLNPIVRLDGQRADGTRLDGYELIPEEFAFLDAEDFRRDAEYAFHLDQLVRQLRDPLPPVGRLVAVPTLPNHYRRQPERVRELRNALLLDLRGPVVVTGAAARMGVQGMAGIGKSVLANALARDLEVRRAFPDGVFWIGLGQDPGEASAEERDRRVVGLQRRLARLLGDEALFDNVHAGKERLRALLADRAALLILDDVWQRSDAEAFDALGPRCKLLLTTRDGGLVAAMAGTHYQVQLPTETEALAILATAAQMEVADLPELAAAVVAECGRLPLALALCGGMVQGGTPWGDLLAALRKHDLEFLASEHAAEEQHRNVWRAIELSVRVLPEAERERFTELAVFAAGERVPEATMLTLWADTGGLDERHARQLLVGFSRRSLVQRDRRAGATDEESATIGLHDLMRHFAHRRAERRAGGIASLHEALLAAYRRRAPGGWASGPDDGYLLQHLRQHLVVVERWDELEAVLTDLAFIARRCATGGTYQLVGDYEAVLAALPEAQEEQERVRQLDERLARYTRELVGYARRWSEARDRHAEDPAGCSLLAPEAIPLPEPPPAVRRWTDEEIAADTARMTNAPTRLDRVRAFGQFVSAESHHLARYGERPGFALQQAFNAASTGPVVRAAEALVGAGGGDTSMLLLRPPRQRAAFNPHSACVQVLSGHGVVVQPTIGVWAVAVTTDGRRAISGGVDRTVRAWDVASGVCLQTFAGHTHAVWAVAITPDGRRAVSASEDRTVRVWDVATGACLRTFTGHTDAVRAVTVTADGRRAISGSQDGTVRVWDVQTGRCLKTLATGSVGAIAVTADARRAVLGSLGNSVGVWDLEGGKCLQSLAGPNSQAGYMDREGAVAVTPDGLRAVSGFGNGTVWVWDLVNGACLHILGGHTADIYAVAVTADGSRVVSGSGDGTVRVWDLTSGACLQTLVGHSYRVRAVAVTADGRRAISSDGENQTVRVWDLVSGACVPLVGHTGGVWAVGVTPDGRRAVSSGNDGTVQVWDRASGACLQRLAWHKGPVVAVAVTPDGRRAVSGGGQDDKIRVWDVRSGACLQTLIRQVREGVRSVLVTPDGRRAVSGSGTGKVRVWDLASGVCLQTLDAHKGPVCEVAVTPDGRRAVSGGEDQMVRVWDLANGNCLQRLVGHKAPVWAVAVTPDGRRAVSGSWDGTVRVWDLAESCAEVASLSTDRPPLPGLRDLWRDWWDEVFSGVTAVMEASYRDEVPMRYEPSTGRLVPIRDEPSSACLHTLTGHTHRVWAVAVTPDGRRSVSGSWDGSIRVWDLERGVCLHTLAGHTGRVLTVAVTIDGQRAVSGSEDQTVRVWDLSSGACLQTVAAHTGWVLCLTVTADGIVFGTRAGEVSSLRPTLTLLRSLPRVTATRLWFDGSAVRPRFLPGWLRLVARRAGRWDERLTVVCAWCGHRFPVDPPDPAAEGTEIRCPAPACHQPLHLNPFVCDLRGWERA